MTWAPDYATLAEIKAYVGDAAGVTDLDDILSLAITAASRAVDRAANRQFGQVVAAEDRYFSAYQDVDDLWYVVPIDDLMDTTGVTVAVDADTDLTYETTYTAGTDFRYWPLNAVAEAKPYTALVFKAGTSLPTVPGAVKVHALWGWSAVPDTIKNAALLQAARVAKRKDAPFGVAGSVELGSQLRLLERLDPDVALMIKDYRRWYGAG